MAVVPVTDNEFKSEVLGRSGLVLVDFWAPWCGPCRQVAPILDSLSEEYEGKLEFRSINVDENPETSAHYRVSSIPTLKIFKAGEEVETIVGVRPKSSLKEVLENALTA